MTKELNWYWLISDSWMTTAISSHLDSSLWLLQAAGSNCLVKFTLQNMKRHGSSANYTRIVEVSLCSESSFTQLWAKYSTHYNTCPLVHYSFSASAFVNQSAMSGAIYHTYCTLHSSMDTKTHETHELLRKHGSHFHQWALRLHMWQGHYKTAR